MFNGKSVFIPASMGSFGRKCVARSTVTPGADMASSRGGVMAYFCKPDTDLYAELST